jgi:hypothetical protein
MIKDIFYFLIKKFNKFFSIFIIYHFDINTVILTPILTPIIIPYPKKGMYYLKFTRFGMVVMFKITVIDL